MGSWGHGSFENDAALDWAGDLCFSKGTDAIAAALTYVVHLGTEYLEVDQAQCAVAAAEVVAALKGAPSPDLPEDVAAWIGRQRIKIGEPWIELALQAVKRVRTDSELLELREESSQNLQEWSMVMTDLETRLRPL